MTKLRQRIFKTEITDDHGGEVPGFDLLMGQRLRQECDPEVLPRGFQPRFKRRTFLPWARVVDCPSGRSRRFRSDYDQFFEAALNEGTV